MTRFKIGQVVKTRPGLTQAAEAGKRGQEAGMGYQPLETFTITSISRCSDGRDILWGAENENGVYADAVILLSDIKKYKRFKLFNK